MKQTAVEWLYERLERMIPRSALYNIDKTEYFEQAKEMEKEQKIEFACKVVEVSAEKYIQGKTTEQIAKELLTFKSE
jgi:hypothetical protein